jgi:hypothetical protein
MPDAPAFWAEDLILSEEESARGERVPSSEIHAELVAALAELDAELADDLGGPLPDVRAH